MIPASARALAEEQAAESVINFFRELDDEDFMEEGVNASSFIRKCDIESSVLDLDETSLSDDEKILVRFYFDQQVRALIQQTYAEEVERRRTSVIKRSSDELSGIVSDLVDEVEQEGQDLRDTLNAMHKAMVSLQDTNIYLDLVDTSRFQGLMGQLMERALLHGNSSPKTVIIVHKIISKYPRNDLSKEMARIVRDLPLLPIWMDLSPEGWGKVFGDRSDGLVLQALIERLFHISKNDLRRDFYTEEIRPRLRELFPEINPYDLNWDKAEATFLNQANRLDYMKMASACHIIDTALTEDEDPMVPYFYPNAFQRLFESP